MPFPLVKANLTDKILRPMSESINHVITAINRFVFRDDSVELDYELELQKGLDTTNDIATLELRADDPGLVFYNTNVATDEARWLHYVDNNGDFHFGLLPDTGAGLVDVMETTRSTTSVTRVNFPTQGKSTFVVGHTGAVSPSMALGASADMDTGMWVYSDTSGEQVGYAVYANDGTRNGRAFFGIHDNGVWGLSRRFTSKVGDFIIEDGGEEYFRGNTDAAVELFYNNVSTARTATAANGGLEANNTSTGLGYERVLTESDLVTVIYAIKDGDKSLGTSVLEDDNDLFGLALTADTRYGFEMFIEAQSITASANLKFDLQFSQTPADTGSWRHHTVDTAGTTYSDAAPDVTTATTADLGTNTRSFTQVIGWFQSNASTGGTVDFRWAQNVGDAGNPTSVYEGSWIRIYPMS